MRASSSVAALKVHIEKLSDLVEVREGWYQCALSVGSRSGWAGLQSRGEKKLERGGQQRRAVPQARTSGSLCERNSRQTARRAEAFSALLLFHWGQVRSGGAAGLWHASREGYSLWVLTQADPWFYSPLQRWIKTWRACDSSPCPCSSSPCASRCSDLTLR